MLTVLGLDPGTANFGYAVVQVFMQPKYKYRIITHGMIDEAVQEMSGLDVGERMQKFEKRIRSLKRMHNIDVAVGERFMTRGHKGTTIEAVSAMLGITASVFKNEVAFIPASQWKNAINKKLELEGLYESMKHYGIAAHRVDAVGIALYGSTLSIGEPHYSTINSKDLKKHILGAR